MTTELVLLGTAGAPLPVAGRSGISSALIVDGRVFVIDCGRGSPSAFVEAGLEFQKLEAVFLTHLHADHIGDVPGLLLYGWGVRAGDDGPLAPIRVYGPSRPAAVPAGDALFHRGAARRHRRRPRTWPDQGTGRVRATARKRDRGASPCHMPSPNTGGRGGSRSRRRSGSEVRSAIAPVRAGHDPKPSSRN